MDNQQSLSGDIKDIQRDHESTDKSSLLQRRLSNKILQQHQQQPLQPGETPGEISPMPTGAERMAALRDLGATFEEGKRSIAKVATPTETVVPSFVDSEHLEKMLHKNEKSSLSHTCDKSVAH